MYNRQSDQVSMWNLIMKFEGAKYTRVLSPDAPVSVHAVQTLHQTTSKYHLMHFATFVCTYIHTRFTIISQVLGMC